MTDRIAARARVRTWLASPLPREVRGPLDRLARTPGVERIAVMPDVHWAEGVCVGVVVGARDRLFPEAVGGDIGCGMAAEAYDADAGGLREPGVARATLERLAVAVPSLRHGADGRERPLPASLEERALSDPRLTALAHGDGRGQFATLGRGNHFLELQSDDDGRLWAMVHSGSRAMGPRIHAHHLEHARRERVGLPGLTTDSDEGRAYLADVAWAVEYAERSRAAMLDALAGVLAETLGTSPVPGSRFGCLHNHVRLERHGDDDLYVHRKGAVSAGAGERGVVPGSMGTASYHTEGRGHEYALTSCAHGAGRALSRGEARRSITVRDFDRQMGDVAYDSRRARDLVEEAPDAYKDIHAVMRAQADLVRIVRRVRPILAHKGV
jgi:tRNA-splicing ligase RtcB